MNRLDTLFQTLRARNEKAMGLFVTCGFPEPSATLPVLDALVAGGADFIELGMPFSDPLAEGLTIQHSSERALEAGVTLRHVLDTVRAFRSRHDTPLLLMGYLNPVFRFGVEAFCREASGAGADGLILPDLPLEERSLIEGPATAAGLALVHLIAPNTPLSRVEAIDARATGFVYAVSVTGLTGGGLSDREAVTAYLERVRPYVRRNPLLVGFGIRNRDDALRLTTHTDGFIVGSALIRQVETLWTASDRPPAERLEALAAFVRSLRTEAPV